MEPLAELSEIFGGDDIGDSYIGNSEDNFIVNSEDSYIGNSEDSYIGNSKDRYIVNSGGNAETGLVQLNLIIDKAQEIIRQSRQETIYPSALVIEKFLSDSKIPVNPYYDEKDFYTYNAYPIIGFIEVINYYNETIKPLVENSAKSKTLNENTALCKPFIYNFIHNVYWGKFELVKFFNIFYPNHNHKFMFDTYQAEARLNKQLSMIYIHPKYLIEEILHKLCLLEYMDKFSELVERKNELMKKWEELDGKIPESIIIDSTAFNSTQSNILSTISTINAPIVKCFYDRNIPIIITNSLGIDLIERVIKSTTANYERRENSAKSFFDNRIRNTIFRIQDKQIVKVFPLLDYEVVPLIREFTAARSAKARYSDTRNVIKSGELFMDCHPNIAIRLAFNEYITYNIVGAADIAETKLRLYLGLIEKFGIKQIDLNERMVTGVYYPFEMYIKEMRVKSILHNIGRKK